MSTSEDPVEIEVRNFQIVNGIQTTHTLFEAYDSNRSLKGVNIVVKISEFPGAENKTFVEKISRASNTQNRILGWDFASQDPMQIRLLDEFRSLPSDPACSMKSTVIRPKFNTISEVPHGRNSQ